MEENNTNNIMLQIIRFPMCIKCYHPYLQCRSIYKKNPYIYFGTKKLYIQNNTY